MTVAIISEYNPFHNGHKYQIDRIRDEFGADTAIIAIMSGNYTQRGELAMADKYLRAEWAVLGGADLVIELPFPYSMSCAEIFAASAVKIIASLNVVDALSFGSECGDTAVLLEIARNMQTSKYREAFVEAASNSALKALGHPALCQKAYEMAFGELSEKDFFSPNNILALEYIKALNAQNCNLKIHTVKRQGAAYDQSAIVGNAAFQSAYALRLAMQSDPRSVIPFIPESVRPSFSYNFNRQKFPCDQERLSTAIISYFRLSSAYEDMKIFDVGGGLYNRLKKVSFEADSISSLIALAETKKYTKARLRRAMWYSFFGVTSSDAKELPLFTQILAFNVKGQALLKRIKERSDFPVITKPSARDELDAAARRQKALLERADSVFHLAKPSHESGESSLRARPFVKK